MRAALIFLALLPSLACAQSWCPPGAMWHYEFDDPNSTGSWDKTYVGDTLIDGYQAHRIVATGVYILDPGTPSEIIIPVTGEEFTTLVDSLLLVRIEDAPIPVWDTLLRFDALPGDRWYVPGHDIICSEISSWDLLEVMDTGHVVVNSIALRYWDLGHYITPDQFQWSGRCFDRLGFPGVLVPLPSCGVMTEGFVSSCYRDDELIFPSPILPSDWCGLPLNTAESEKVQGAVPTPNPGTDHFTLQLPPGVHTVEVVDAMGRTVLREQAANSTTRMATGSLPAGAYSVRVVERDGSLRTMRWVKE